MNKSARSADVRRVKFHRREQDAAVRALGHLRQISRNSEMNRRRLAADRDAAVMVNLHHEILLTLGIEHNISRRFPSELFNIVNQCQIFVVN